MGGSVAVTVREPNGEEHRMCRWTNSLPWFVKNVRLLGKDPVHLKSYLDTWKDMKEDYVKHKSDGKFERNMSALYAPYPFLAPRSYGLVVVDMQRDHILCYNDYTSTDTLAVFQGDISDLSTCDDESNIVRAKEFLEKNKVKRTLFYDRINKRMSPLTGIKSTSDLVNALNNHLEIGLELDMSPYTFISYNPYDNQEAIKMREKVRDLGFKLSDQENALWDKWINDKGEAD